MGIFLGISCQNRWINLGLELFEKISRREEDGFVFPRPVEPTRNLGTWVSQQPESTFVDPFWITLPACHAQVLEQRSAQCISSRGLGSVGLSESNPLFENRKSEISRFLLLPERVMTEDSEAGGNPKHVGYWLSLLHLRTTVQLTTRVR